MCGNVSVGVSAATSRLFRPRQPDEGHGASDLERVNIDTHPHARRRH
jgi:hypothetical protein